MRESRTNARCASRGSRALRAAAAAVALLVPGLAAADEIDARMDRLHDRFQQCTRQHGYDPQSLGSTGPHEVAPGELQWRECAYDGVREIMVPASAVPDAYETLIALDRVMTREIEAGKRTRDQRRDRIQGMLDDILNKERDAGAHKRRAASAELEADRAALLARERELRKMRRIESMMR